MQLGGRALSHDLLVVGIRPTFYPFTRVPEIAAKIANNKLYSFYNMIKAQTR